MTIIPAGISEDQFLADLISRSLRGYNPNHSEPTSLTDFLCSDSEGKSEAIHQKTGTLLGTRIERYSIYLPFTSYLAKHLSPQGQLAYAQSTAATARTFFLNQYRQNTSHANSIDSSALESEEKLFTAKSLLADTDYFRFVFEGTNFATIGAIHLALLAMPTEEFCQLFENKDFRNDYCQHPIGLNHRDGHFAQKIKQNLLESAFSTMPEEKFVALMTNKYVCSSLYDWAPDYESIDESKMKAALNVFDRSSESTRNQIHQGWATLLADPEFQEICPFHIRNILFDRVQATQNPALLSQMLIDSTIPLAFQVRTRKTISECSDSNIFAGLPEDEKRRVLENPKDNFLRNVVDRAGTLILDNGKEARHISRVLNTAPTDLRANVEQRIVTLLARHPNEEGAIAVTDECLSPSSKSLHITIRTSGTATPLEIKTRKIERPTFAGGGNPYEDHNFLITH